MENANFPPANAVRPGQYKSWFFNKLTMGMSWKEYSASLITPYNIVFACILAAGLPLMAMRFISGGLAVTTAASQDYPWGLFLGWGLFGGVPLSATGFVMATAVYIFGFKKYHPILRLAVLTGFMGYLFAVVFLLNDLGRPWRIYYAMVITLGPISVLFLVAWHVALYLTVQLMEFSPAILEWLNSRHVRRWAVIGTIGLTIAGIILSTLHQSALGAMWLLMPGKVFPLWYSPMVPVMFLTSAVYAAFSMVIVVSTLASHFLRDKCGRTFLETLDEITLGLGKAAAVVIFVYFCLKVISVAHDSNWNLLFTAPYGYIFLVEVLGFSLLPGIIYYAGFKTKSVGLVRLAGFWAVAGVLMNRLDTVLVAFNYQLPNHLTEIIPGSHELMVVLTITTLHIIVFRWILNRMPVLRERVETGGD